MFNRIINTNKDKCTGCNKCIMVCPIKYANNVEIINGERKIEIDKYRCIGCGKCIQICDHGARSYVDDSERFWKDLSNGEKITLIVAPSFLTNKYEDYKNIFGYFKSLGVNHIYDVSLGADITSWAYIQNIKNNKNSDILISQSCPPITNYVERYTTDLITNLIPVQSPALSMAVYLKKYSNINDKIAFISPCIAKKSEMDKDSSLDLIDYNVTFERIFSYISENNIDISKFPKVDFDNDQKGLGTMYSSPGGLKANLLYHFPDLRIKQMSGTEKVYEYLNFLNEGYRLNNYEIIDVLNCSNGCNVGTAACKEICPIDTSLAFEDEILNEKRSENQNKIQTKINFDEYDKLFEYFNKTLNLDDFTIKYKNKSDTIKLTNPTDEELEIAFNSLKKYDEESRKINCYSCGYKTCKDMAIAIHNNYNIPLSCYQYNKTELELQKNISDYIRTILEYLAKSILVTDNKGLIKFINKKTENILGFTSDECLNKHIGHFIKDIDLTKLQELSTQRYKCVRKNGDNRVLRLEQNSITLKNEEFIIFLIEDVTEQLELDNIKNNFIAMISHELRTPLTSIRGALGLISSGAMGEIPEKSKSLLNIANNNVIRLVNLLNEILDLEKIKAGKMDFKFEELQVMPLIEETILLNTEYAKQFNVKYEIKERLENVLINVDKNKFIQVLTNLLSNAAKFSFPDETVEIYVKKNMHLISVSVVNKGSGIPEESCPRIFESFYQVDSSDSKKKVGSGLGLNICKSIVEKMGGKIGFNSIVNETTTFYFEFQEIYNKDEKQRVLIIEDNKTTAYGIKTMFERLNYITNVAFNAAEAENLLKTNEYDLITLDIILPDKNGLELLDEIKNNKSTQNIPVIIISATSKDMLNDIAKQEITDYLEKSFNIEDLQKTINDVILQKAPPNVNILHVKSDTDTLNINQLNFSNIKNTITATKISDAEALLNKSVFDLIILDYKLIGSNYDDFINMINATPNNQAKLVILSDYDLKEFVPSQVDEVISKTNISNEQFCECIEKFTSKKTEQE